MKLSIASVLAIATVVFAYDNENTMEVAISFVKDCQGDYFLCVKEKLLKIVDNVRSSRSIQIVDGVILKGDPDKRMGKKLDVLPDDESARDTEVNYRLLEGVVSLFETHAVEITMDKTDKETLQRSLEEGRGKKKKQAGAAALIGLMGAKFILGKLLIVKLIALKALATAKIALVLAIIIIVAWCLKHDHTKTTYEVIPHAHHHDAHVEHISHDSGHEHGGYGSYGSDWSKNLDEAQNLAYNAYSGHRK